MKRKDQQRFLSAQAVSAPVPTVEEEDGIVSIEYVPIAVIRESRTRPQPSLSPGPSVMEACAEGAAWAEAIRDSYRFCNRNFPVTTMTRQQLDAMTAARHTYF